MKKAGKMDIDLGDAAQGENPEPDHAAIRNLSGVADGRDLNGLFLCDDEGTMVRFLRYGGGDAVHEPASDIALADLLSAAGWPVDREQPGADAPLRRAKEMDLEGLSCDRDLRRLWFTGSHTRTAPKKDKFAPPELRPNRLALGYVVTSGAPPWRALACVESRHAGTAVLAVLTTGILAPYARLASKRNGPDIEGIAACGDTIYLGLRGPVIEEFAAIVRIDFVASAEATSAAPRRLAVAGSHVFLLSLDGKGVHDLAFDGDRLLILTGAMGDRQDGAALWEWSPPATSPASGHSTVPGADLRKLDAFKGSPKGDAPECFDILEWDGKRRLLLVRDNPDDSRIEDGRVYRAELFEAP